MIREEFTEQMQSSWVTGNAHRRAELQVQATADYAQCKGTEKAQYGQRSQDVDTTCRHVGDSRALKEELNQTVDGLER